MIADLWNNKWNILRNYIAFLNRYRFVFCTLFVILGLIGIYAYFRYMTFKAHERVPPSLKCSYTPKGCDNETFGVVLGCKRILDPTVPEQDDAIEPFTNAPQPTPEPIQWALPAPDFVIRVVIPSYVAKFDQANLQARGFTSRTDAEKAYKHMLQPMTNGEIDRVHKAVTSYLTTPLSQKWYADAILAKGAPWLEAGMPHTHDNVIIMNADWIAKPVCSTFYHELTHVAQRQWPDKFRDLYTQWGFHHVENGGAIQGLESVLPRHNPDANDFGWVWMSPSQRPYWINAVFTSASPEDLKTVTWLAYPLTAALPNYRYTGSPAVGIDKLTEFRDAFGTGPNHYHPNEIAAQYAEYYFCGTSSPFPAYVQYKAWLDAWD